MQKRSNIIVQLIDAYQRVDAPSVRSNSLTERGARYLYDCGLAAIALEKVEFDEDAVSVNAKRLFLAADRTARVIHGQLRATTMEILDIAGRHEIPVILLKGISVAEDFYAEPHHRVMGDVDVLVPVEKADTLHRLLREARYLYHAKAGGKALTRGHHHLPALYDPERDVAVEVHTSLFSDPPPPCADLFEVSTIWDLAEHADLHGHRCLKFGPEFQLVYTVAHWATDGKWAVNVISINDVVCMIRRADRPIDWRLIKSWIETSPLLADHLAVLLLFLQKTGIAEIPDELKGQAEDSARRIGAVNMRILHWLMRTFPLSGRTKVAWAITTTNALVIWRTLLEPRHKSVRLIVAGARVLSRRPPGKSLLSSTAGRLRTLIAPND